MATDLTTIPKEDAKLIKSLDLALREGIKQANDGMFCAGVALKEFRDKKLYRYTHENFEDFSEETYSISRANAYRLIEWVEVEENVNPCQITFPLSQIETTFTHLNAPSVPSPAVAKELAKAPPEEQKALFDDAVATAPKDASGKPKVTAKHVEKVAATRATPTQVKAEANQAAFDATAKHAQQEQDQAPWADFVMEVESALAGLETMRDELNEVLDGKKGDNKCRHFYAHFIPYLGTIGSIDQAIKTVRENLPGAKHEDKPFYIPVRSVKMRAEKVGAR